MVFRKGERGIAWNVDQQLLPGDTPSVTVGVFAPTAFSMGRPTGAFDATLVYSPRRVPVTPTAPVSGLCPTSERQGTLDLYE